jgi:mevalonate kinase
MNYYSCGKLLITAEYLILKGAKGLAIPTKYGQKLSVKKHREKIIVWQAYTCQNEKWIDCQFDLSFKLINSKKTKSEYIYSLSELLKKINELSPGFAGQGLTISTSLEFKRNWGLGSSSTLINNISNWLKINPYELLKGTYRGSGYDIAVANCKKSIFFQKEGDFNEITHTKFSPPFKDNLFFIHLNKKVNSQKEVTKFLKNKKGFKHEINKINSLGEMVAKEKKQETFNQMLKEHEEIISKIICQKPIQKVLFKDFYGQIKSLGSWGGDFILASGDDETPSYFSKKGFDVIVPFSKMKL